MQSREELLEENARLKKEKERLEALLKEYNDGTKEDYTIKEKQSPFHNSSYYYEEDQRKAVRKVYDMFRQNRAKGFTASDFVSMAQYLGAEIDISEPQEMINARNMAVRYGKRNHLNFEEFYSWWNTEPAPPMTPLNALRYKLRSRSLLRAIAHYHNLYKEIEKPDLRNKLFKFHSKIKAGDFGEAASAINLRYTNDPAIGKASRDELKVGPNALILSASFTLKPDIDEFELGELAGTIGDILLMGKKSLQFHSHKSQLVKERGEKVMRFSIFYDEHKDVEQHIKPLFRGLDLRRAEGRAECSQRPGGPDDGEFIKARGEGWLELGVSMVEFFNDILNDGKKEATKNFWNQIAAFRGLDLDLDIGCMEKAYNKFALAFEAETDLFKGVTGFASLKNLMMPLALELHNNHNIPAPVKDAYYSASTFLKGVHSVRLQIDNQILSLEGENVDIFDLLPTKADIGNYRPPAPVQKPPPKQVKPLFSQDDMKFALLGAGGVGKSAITVQYVQNIFVEHYDPTIEDTYRKQTIIDGSTYMLELYDTTDSTYSWGESYLASAAGFFLIYSVTDKNSFTSLNELKDKVTRIKGGTQPPILLVANKIDIAGDARKITTKEGQDLADSWGVPFIEVSAKTSTNISEAVAQMVRIVTAKQEKDEGAEDWFLGTRANSY